jgi:hypothetical protein
MLTITAAGLSAALVTLTGFAPSQGTTTVKPTTPTLTAPAPAALAAPLHSQPWREPSGSFDSAVVSCEINRPHRVVALDDWIARVNSPITRIEWWGWTQDPNQLKRPFWIAVRKHNPATNKPDMAGPPLWKRCMVPTQAGQVGKDCHGNPIYKFTAKFAQPFFYQKVGQHYWLQISEADKESVRVDTPNFGWSASRPIRFAPAVQHAVTGAWKQPLIDPCPPQDKVDLAFVLWRV